jgi:hypothetical protein
VVASQPIRALLRQLLRPVALDLAVLGTLEVGSARRLEIEEWISIASRDDSRPIGAWLAATQPPHGRPAFQTYEHAPRLAPRIED